MLLRVPHQWYILYITRSLGPHSYVVSCVHVVSKEGVGLSNEYECCMWTFGYKCIWAFVDGNEMSWFIFMLQYSLFQRIYKYERKLNDIQNDSLSVCSMNINSEAVIGRICGFFREEMANERTSRVLWDPGHADLGPHGSLCQLVALVGIRTH